MSIQVLRGPSVSTDNPVLAEGQPYVDVESNPPKLKIGDGVTNLNSLPYIGAEFASDVYRNDGIYPTRTPFTIATADIPIFSLDTKQIHVDTIYSKFQDTIHLMNSILPTDIAVNLGDASTRFNYIYGNNIYGNSFIGTSASITQVDGQNAAFSGEVNTPVCKVTTLDSNTGGNIIVGKGLIPTNDNYYTLGSDDKEWTNLYVKEVHCAKYTFINSISLEYRGGTTGHVGSNLTIDNHELVDYDSLAKSVLGSYTRSTVTANRALVSSSSGKLSASSITSTELGYLDGVTSNIQTQLNGKAASSHSHSYLPLSGGSINGGITVSMKSSFNGDLVANKEFICASRVTITGTNYPHVRTTDPTCTIGKDTSNQLCIQGGVIRPGGDGAQNLGNGSHRWAVVYAKSGSINTSDKNEKKDIQELEEQYSKDIIMGLKPVSYKFIKNDSNRTHNGFIAQDIEESLTSMGITTQDFAAVCKWQKVYCEDGVNDIPIEGEYSYGLRYEELIAPLVKVVQFQQQEIDTLKTQLESLISHNA